MAERLHDHAALDLNRPGKHTYEIAFHHDGTWGNVMMPLTVINGERGPGKSVVCFGGTHGNEFEGPVAVWRLARDLDPAQLAGRVILLPRFNVPACDAGTRESPLDGVNMNRAFPGNPRGSITYRMADFVTQRLFPHVDVVLDIHSGGRILHFPHVSSFHIVKDAAQQAEMHRVAALFDTPFIMVYSSEMAHGLLTDEAEALGKITIGTEFGYGESVDRLGTAHAYEGIRNTLKHYGLLEGEVTRVRPAGSPAPKVVQATRLEDYLPCPIAGIYEPTVDPGDWVEEGQLCARIFDFDYADSAPLEIRAPRAGYVLCQAFAAAVPKGQTCLVIAEEVPGWA